MHLCHKCKALFDLSVPPGSEEEKEAKCPECGSMNIERLTALVVELPPYCG